MAGRRPRPDGVVIYSPLAAQDYSDIHDYTAGAWGYDQAERYCDHLDKAASLAALNSHLGKPLQVTTEARARYVKWPKARYGHYIIYLPMIEGIYVLRILHAAMDPSNYL